MSAFGGKADIFNRKAHIEMAPITVFIVSLKWEFGQEALLSPSILI